MGVPIVAAAAFPLLFAAVPHSTRHPSRRLVRSSFAATPTLIPRSRHLHQAVQEGGEDGAFGRLLSLSRCEIPSGTLTLRPNRSGYRGIHVDSEENVQEGDVLLSVPLGSCIRGGGEDNADDENDERWPLSLARSFLQREHLADAGNTDPLFDTWSKLLPDQDELRAALPVHWSGDALNATGLRSFRAKVEKDRLVRSKLVRDLLGETDPCNDDDGEENESSLSRRRSPNEVLDLIYTRAVRTEDETGKFYGHFLAPCFDMINHAGHGWNNAAYSLERAAEQGPSSLVVRAKRGLDPGEEILIDYGEGTRDLRCLHNYGFLADPARGGELGGGAEVIDDEGGVHVLKRGFPYGLTPELLLTASAVRMGNDKNEPNPSLGENEAVWIVGLIDNTIRELTGASKSDGSIDINISKELAAEVRRAAGLLLARCRQGLVADRIKSPLRRVELTLRKPGSIR